MINPQLIAEPNVSNKILIDVLISPSLNKTIGPKPAPELNPATVAPMDNPVCKKASAMAIDAAQFGINPKIDVTIICITGFTFNDSINSAECVKASSDAIIIVITNTQK